MVLSTRAMICTYMCRNELDASAIRIITANLFFWREDAKFQDSEEATRPRSTAHATADPITGTDPTWVQREFGCGYYYLSRISFNR